MLLLLLLERCQRGMPLQLQVALCCTCIAPQPACQDKNQQQQPGPLRAYDGQTDNLKQATTAEQCNHTPHAMTPWRKPPLRWETQTDFRQWPPRS